MSSPFVQNYIRNSLLDAGRYSPFGLLPRTKFITWYGDATICVFGGSWHENIHSAWRHAYHMQREAHPHMDSLIFEN